MFAHIFVTRFKCILRDKQTMFWTLLFPVILATVFYFAFSGLSKAWVFTKFDIAVVNNSQFLNDTMFKSALDSVDGKDKASKSQVLFNVTYCDKSKADELLANSKIYGYVDYDGSPKLVVKASGINQSILKSFLDQYKQTAHAAATIIKTNPAAAVTIGSSISDNTTYLKDVSQGKSKPNQVVNYFYALISMACLYGGFFGMKEVNAVQANQSAQGARVNLAPVHKLKVFFSSICAATAVQALCTFVMLAYLVFVLNVDFGTKIPLILLACVASSLTGVSFGAFLGSVVKAGEVLKISLLISLSMVMSFLSGLMYIDMKYIVEKNAPVIAFLNPANAVTDAFYSLYYYDTNTRFFTNIAILIGFSTIFYLGVYFVMRRQKYDSI